MRIHRIYQVSKSKVAKIPQISDARNIRLVFDYGKFWLVHEDMTDVENVYYSLRENQEAEEI